MSNPPPLPQTPGNPRAKTPWLAMVSVFVVVFLLTSIISIVGTLIQPEVYASTARIKLDLDPANSEPAFFMKTEMELMSSQMVLTNVVRKLNLNEVWGKKYFNGEMLKTVECLQILQGRMMIAPVPGTRLIKITVYSDDPNESAQTANATAEAYRDYCDEMGLARTSATSDAGKITTVNVMIIDPAQPNHRPVKPNKPLDIMLGVITGVVLGVIAAAVIGCLLIVLARNGVRYSASRAR